MNSHGAWELPEDLQQLQDVVRRFIDKEVKPAEDHIEHDSFELPKDKMADLEKKAKALGLWCIRTPTEFGGTGLNLLSQSVVTEEATKVRMGAYHPACGAFGKDPPNVIFSGTRDQIERYGIPSVRGEKRGFIAISEPSGGSDPARAIRTRAERKGDRYILRGAKMWITDVDRCDWGIVFARTGEQGDRGGITSFIVETGWKGVTYKHIPVIRKYPPFELRFDDVEVPVENRLGEEGRGFALTEKWAVEARVPYSAASIGPAQAALDLVIPWTRQRETFGSKLADKQAIQWMLADSEMELRAARLLIYQAAWRGDLGRNLKVDASIAKVVSTETAFRVIDRCIQIFGGLGVTQEMPLERWFREARIRRIGEGPSEVQRMVVARHLIGGAR